MDARIETEREVHSRLSSCSAPLLLASSSSPPPHLLLTCSSPPLADQPGDPGHGARAAEGAAPPRADRIEQAHGGAALPAAARLPAAPLRRGGQHPDLVQRRASRRTGARRGHSRDHPPARDARGRLRSRGPLRSTSGGGGESGGGAASLAARVGEGAAGGRGSACGEGSGFQREERRQQVGLPDNVAGRATPTTAFLPSTAFHHLPPPPTAFHRPNSPLNLSLLGRA